MLVESGDTEPDHNAFPGLVVTSAGNLLMAYRKATDHNIDTTAVIVARSSSDGGATWSAESTIYTPPEGRDPRDTTLFKSSSGRIFRTFFDRNAVTDVKSYVAYSDDDGISWSGRINVSPPGHTELDAITGPLIELSGGRLLLAVQAKHPDATLRDAVIMYSDDQGDTWAQLSIAADGDNEGVSFFEPYLLNLANGDLYCALRTPIEKHWYAISSDNGSTWSVSSTTISQGGRPTVIQATNGDVLLFGRQDTYNYLRVSGDNGATWGASLILDDGFRGAYAQAVETAPNEIAVVWSMEYPNAGTARIGFSYVYIDGATPPL